MQAWKSILVCRKREEEGKGNEPDEDDEESEDLIKWIVVLREVVEP